MTKNKFSKTVLSLVLAASVVTIAPSINASAADCGCIEYAGSHIVKQGDTMFSIAKKNGLAVEQLMDANFTADTKLLVGQKVMIPSKEQSWYGDVKQPIDKLSGSYTVRSGDTVYSISKRAGITLADLKKFNGLKSNYIRVGEVLKLNDTYTAEKPSAHQKAYNVSSTTYTVKAGDTKYNLQNKFGKTIKLPTGTLKAGQKLPINGNVLVIPTADFALADGRVIEVVAGDSFYPVNVYGGNDSIERLAYRTDRKMTFVVVQVDQRKELVSYSIN